MEEQIKHMKLGLSSGLLSKRNSPSFNTNNFDTYFSKDQSTVDKIRVLIRAGVYDLRKPNIEEKIREDWYKSPSATTPTRIVKEELKMFNKSLKTPLPPISLDKKGVSTIKKMLKNRKTELRKSSKVKASIK